MSFYVCSLACCWSVWTLSRGFYVSLCYFYISLWLFLQLFVCLHCLSWTFCGRFVSLSLVVLLFLQLEPSRGSVTVQSSGYVSKVTPTRLTPPPWCSSLHYITLHPTCVGVGGISCSTWTRRWRASILCRTARFRVCEQAPIKTVSAGRVWLCSHVRSADKLFPQILETVQRVPQTRLTVCLMRRETSCSESRTDSWEVNS